MSRSIAGAKFVTSSLYHRLSASLFRRCYAATSVGPKGGLKGDVMIKQEEKKGRSEPSAWGPHPLTGYYRPLDYVEEIDPVDLRAMFLKQRVKPQSS